MTTLIDEVRKVVLDVCHPEEPDVSDENRSLLQNGLDSLDYASVLMALEDKYDVNLSEADVEQLLSIRQIADYLSAQGKS